MSATWDCGRPTPDEPGGCGPLWHRSTATAPLNGHGKLLASVAPPGGCGTAVCIAWTAPWPAHQQAPTLNTRCRRPQTRVRMPHIHEPTTHMCACARVCLSAHACEAAPIATQTARRRAHQPRTTPSQHAWLGCSSEACPHQCQADAAPVDAKPSCPRRCEGMQRSGSAGCSPLGELGGECGGDVGARELEGTGVAEQLRVHQLGSQLTEA